MWMAGATLATYWGLALGSFLLRVLNDPSADVGGAVLSRLGWGAYPTVGALIVARRPRNPVGWLCCAVGLLLGPAFFGQDYAWYVLVHAPGALPGGLAMAWLGQWPWRVVLGLLSFLLLLFPMGGWCPGVGGRSPGRPLPVPSCWACGRRSRPSRWRGLDSSG
jgi:hypothetical protein